MANNDIRMRVLMTVDGKKSVVEVTSSVKELQGALSAAKSKSDRMRESLAKFTNYTRLWIGVQNGIPILTSAMQPFIDKANNAAVVQTKLRTVMGKGMNASEQDVASFKPIKTFYSMNSWDRLYVLIP
ncbi:MAG TPA: hypothetical protein DIS88_00475 [Prevotella sp.]|nr:hypothetical protein [Prevotella sp.]